MAFRKILAVLTLLAASTPAQLKHASLRGQRAIFDDDPSWPSHYRTHKSNDSVGNEVDKRNYKVCETEECKIVAAEFLSSMNKSVDPCDDFYEFACGAWSQKEPIPPHKASWSRIMIFQNTVEHRIKGILESNPDISDILPVRQAKKWYRSCMNTENLKRRGLKPIESILMRVGGWPITMDDDEWDTEMYPWQKVERHYARLTGAYTLYNVEVSSFEDRKFGELIISAPDIPFGDELSLKYRNYRDNDYHMYIRIVEGAARLFVQHNHTDVLKERITKQAEELVEFEKEIYELKQKYHWKSMTFDEFVKWYDTNMKEVNGDPKAKIHWSSVIQRLFNMVNIQINPSTKLFSHDFEYIKGIGKLLKRTSARTIVNYIHWNFVSRMFRYTTERMRDDLFEVANKEYGVKERAPRWSECVNDVMMKDAVAFAFVDKYFTNSTESAALEIMKNIQIGMEDQIEKSNWLDEESKKWVKGKLKNMKMFIGFPDWYKNRTSIIHRYKGLTIDTDYFHNTLIYMRYEAKKRLKLLSGSEDKFYDIWSLIDPITVNAVYRGDINVVGVPAANFQPPLFTPQFPNNINYATVGIIAGHEMSHGFDDYAIRYGINQNAARLPEDVLKNYYQSAKCFLDQYDEYFEDYFGKKAPKSGRSMVYRPERSMSEQTRGENIADSTSIQSVFEAYKKVNEKSLFSEMRLPGLEEFTDDQLFFLSAAGMWCNVHRSENEKKKEEARDVHSPQKFRVIGAMSNTKDFAKAFNCPKGSPMNPSKKCNIWVKPAAAMQKEPSYGAKKINRYRWGRRWKS